MNSNAPIANCVLQDLIYKELISFKSFFLNASATMLEVILYSDRAGIRMMVPNCNAIV